MKISISEYAKRCQVSTQVIYWRIKHGYIKTCSDKKQSSYKKDKQKFIDVSIYPPIIGIQAKNSLKNK